YTAATQTVGWTLRSGLALNGLLPGRDVLNFDRTYTLSVHGVVATSTRAAIRGTFSSRFSTEPLHYSVVAAGSDPQPGTASAAIDPFPVFVGATLTAATLAFAIDIALETATATAPGNVFLQQVATPPVVVSG